MHSTIFFAVSALATFASAQSSSSSSASSSASGSSSSGTATASGTASQAMPPQATASFNPAQVPAGEPSQWCSGQLHTCPEICDGSASINRCDPTQFTYNCVCSNGTVPDVTAYQQTLPFFICQETFRQCSVLNANNLDGLNTCATNEQCGTLNATTNQKASTTSSSAGSAATTSGSGGSGSAPTTTMMTSSSSSASAAASPTKSGNAATQIRSDVATTALIGLLAAAVKLFL